jgi:hypothetical protein
MKRVIAYSSALDVSDVDQAVTNLLRTDADHYSWVAATVGSISAARYQLAAQEPVMAIGGYHSSDPVPTLAQFEKFVSEGRIHYFISDQKGVAGALSRRSMTAGIARIVAWAESHATHQNVGAVTIYDLASEGTSGIR